MTCVHCVHVVMLSIFVSISRWLLVDTLAKSTNDNDAFAEPTPSVSPSQSHRWHFGLMIPPYKTPQLHEYGDGVDPFIEDDTRQKQRAHASQNPVPSTADKTPLDHVHSLDGCGRQLISGVKRGERHRLEKRHAGSRVLTARPSGFFRVSEDDSGDPRRHSARGTTSLSDRRYQFCVWGLAEWVRP